MTVGTHLQQYTCNMTGAQQWKLTAIAGGAYTITNINSGQCVDVVANSAADGAAIDQYTCNNTTAQSFTLTDRGGGYYSIVNSNGKCLDVTGAALTTGTAIQQWACGTTAQNQQWTFR
jgi:hypothetical protein